MKVVLVKHIPKLGMKGDVCTVSDGYARNFLFPQKVAVPASAHALAEGEHWRKEREAYAVEDLHHTEDIARRLDGFELEFHEKAHESGTLFAAVTVKKIADALQKRGFAVVEKNVALEHPLKELGEYDAVLHLPHGLEVTIRVIITGAK